MDSCCFCGLSQSKEIILPNLSIVDYANLEEHFLLETDSIIVKTEVTGIKPYHFLIITKNHYPSFKSFNLENPYNQDLQLALLKITEFYNNILGLMLLAYEHGGICNANNKSNCIDHAHIHTIPLTFDEITLIKDTIISLLGEPSTEMYSNYFYLKSDISNEMYWQDNIFVSQYFRNVICNVLSLEHRNTWEKCAIEDKNRIESIQWHLLTKDIKL